MRRDTRRDQRAKASALRTLSCAYLAGVAVMLAVDLRHPGLKTAIGAPLAAIRAGVGTAVLTTQARLLRTSRRGHTDDEGAR